MRHMAAERVWFIGKVEAGAEFKAAKRLRALELERNESLDRLVELGQEIDGPVPHLGTVNIGGRK